MTAVKSGLMIVDQHRADIRIRYERYMHQLNDTPAQSQRLLFPEMVELAPSEAARMEELLPALSAVGFELTPLGPTAYAVNGVPVGIEGLQPDVLIRELLHEADGLSARLHQDLALSLARQAAIPYGQQLSNEEMDMLVNDLFACENVNYTPDGRAVLCILPQHDIEQLMG